MNLNRRQFIQGSAAAGALAFAPLPLCAAKPAKGTPPVEIIDCHTHIYDPGRKEGVPWPPREEARLYRAITTAEIRKAAGKTGLTGTVVVEASEWLADNDWVLKQAEKEPFIVGFIGHLPLEHEDFEKQLRRLALNPVFRGLRVRGERSSKIATAASLKSLALMEEYGLTLDFNCLPPHLPMIAQVAKALPKLRIVINHIANLTVDGKSPPDVWRNGMREAGQHENVFLKVSGMVEGSRRDDFRAPRELDFYRPVLDIAVESFGAERLLFASNWPVSGLFAPYETVHGLVHQYFTEKGAEAAAKVCGENSKRAYNWMRRK